MDARRKERELPDLYARVGDEIVDAPLEDRRVAATYRSSATKGPLSASGERLTLLTAKSVYSPGETIRVIHMYEATLPGVEVGVMGPKRIYGESVDGVLRTPVQPEWESYDGLVLKSPAIDHNFEVTTYRLPPGRHVILWRWKPSGWWEISGRTERPLVSNRLEVEVR